jgi:spermidine synthase
MDKLPGPVVLIEPLSGNTTLLIRIRAIHAVKRPKYQTIIIADTEDYDRALIVARGPAVATA